VTQDHWVSGYRGFEKASHLIKKIQTLPDETTTLPPNIGVLQREIASQLIVMFMKRCNVHVEM
jgi:hypothetical protein